MEESMNDSWEPNLKEWVRLELGDQLVDEYVQEVQKLEKDDKDLEKGLLAVYVVVCYQKDLLLSIGRQLLSVQIPESVERFRLK